MRADSFVPRGMNTFLRASLVLFPVAFVLAGGAARADVVPDGQRYVEATNEVVGSATLTGRTLMLVTLNDRVRSMVRIVPSVGDGPVAVPGGYRNASYLVALTPDERAELDKVRAGSWSYEPSSEREEPGPLRKFFDRKELASSEALPFRYLVPRSSGAQSVRLQWTITGVAGDAIQLSVVTEALDQTGAALTTAAGSVLPIALAGAGAVALGIAVFFLMRRRARGLPRAA